MNVTREQLLAWGYDPEMLRAAESAAGKPLSKELAAKRPKVAPEVKTVGILPMAGSPGPWRVEVTNWRPTSLNRLLTLHWSARQKIGKEADAAVAAACLIAGVTHAFGKRRIGINLGYPDKCTPMDEDNAKKHLYDALVSCGALVDDRDEFVEAGVYGWTFGTTSTFIEIEECDGNEAKHSGSG